MGRGFKKRFFKFQSTRPRGRTRQGYNGNELQQTCFNPRVLAGGRDWRKVVGDMSTYMFQSTRPRGRTRHAPDDDVFGYQVSIHASSREDAT